MRRPYSLPLLALILTAAACAGESPSEQETTAPDRPNILFISVDDLNDWIEPLGGHPQARTPNINRLADEGIVFTRAYTASPGCNPSRTALLTGMHTYTTGMYSNYQAWREVLPDAVTLPAHLSASGYWSAGAGKIFHNDQPDPGSWDAYYPSLDKHMPDYFYPDSGSTVSMPAFETMYGDFDWSPIDIPDEQTGDYGSVAWVIEQLEREHDRPFFLAAGIYRPHVPWYVPREYFELFSLEEVRLPAVLEGDLDDIPERGRDLAYRAGNYHRHVVEAGQWRPAVQGYLASIAYADAMVGRLLEALDASPHADNTIVVLWSDHGWQLGEKEHWRKFALWENVARVVLMLRVPAGTPGLTGGSAVGARSDRVVSLIDMFPTLLDLAGLPPREGLDGRSLVPLLADPSAEWDHPAITTYDYSEFSVRDERWRYIRYIDGSEELYDHEADPEEWANLAFDPAYAPIIEEMAAHIPSDPAPLVETSYQISAHHVPPFRSYEHWVEWKRGKAEAESVPQ